MLATLRGLPVVGQDPPEAAQDRVSGAGCGDRRKGGRQRMAPRPAVRATRLANLRAREGEFESAPLGLRRYEATLVAGGQRRRDLQAPGAARRAMTIS